jgi:chaperone BCS1
MVSVMDTLGKMGLPIFHHNLSNNSSTNNNTSPFPPGIMDTLLSSAGLTSPLLQILLFVYRLLGSHLGIDPTVILTIFGVLWGFSKIVSQLYSQVEGLVDRYFMCAVYVSEQDRIYDHVMKFMSQLPSIKKSQYLTAQTPWRSAWEDEDENEVTLVWTDGGEGEGSPKYINFANHAAKSSPRYVPAIGATAFWHNGSHFRIHRKKESFVTTGWQAMRDTEEIKITCFGRSISECTLSFPHVSNTMKTPSRISWQTQRRPTTKTSTKEQPFTVLGIRSRGATTTCGNR